MTPKVYPQDEMKIQRINEFIVPYKIEIVMDFVENGFLSLMEGTVLPEVVKTISYSQSESAITVQGILEGCRNAMLRL